MIARTVTAVVEQLHACVKVLDDLGYPFAAVHIVHAIDILQNDIGSQESAIADTEE